MGEPVEADLKAKATLVINAERPWCSLRTAERAGNITVIAGASMHGGPLLWLSRLVKLACVNRPICSWWAIDNLPVL